MDIKDLIIVIIGLICGFFLFYRFPKIKKHRPPAKKGVSVVIPCRNEELNIAELLQNLKEQTIKPLEIICVNDQSQDETANIIRQFSNVRLINILNCPNGWKGKPFALTEGAKAAKGDVILFLDADVKLQKDAFEYLFSSYSEYGTFSVQPYHKTINITESMAVFFNLTAIAGTGITLPVKKQRGMFGPVFMIDKMTYFEMGAHEVVKNCIIEDYALGRHYQKNNLSYTLMLGNSSVSFRMYPESLKSQAQGFIKNFSRGFISASLLTTILTFVWLMALTALPVDLISSIVQADTMSIATYSLFYLIATSHLVIISNQAGKFNILMLILYPIALLWFHIIFIISLFKKIFNRKVTWKGRKLKI
ncbi:MAG: glycosyltransferase [Bacillota bacterium]